MEAAPCFASIAILWRGYFAASLITEDLTAEAEAKT